ncbi:MAG: HD domain-containing protein [Desulfosporosinus sp.]|nr:HD domain-containing protein [Desulfosporosinus sp.]
MIRTQDIEAEFNTQLKRISDLSIREKVIETWCKASQEGGWKSIEELRELPFTVVTDPQGISLLQHTKAATEGALALAKIQMETISAFPYVDLDILMAGALLHDINKVVTFERDEKNSFRKKEGPSVNAPAFPGLKIARETGLPDDIIGVIEYECRKAVGNPPNVEAILIHHADMTTFDTMIFFNREERSCKDIHTDSRS